MDYVETLTADKARHRYELRKPVPLERPAREDVYRNAGFP
jgi:hypothetical protein